ncbi:MULTISPECIES: branched-chain amino acid transport system II carrier protein [unclassified Granulicatella]|uniref:branched-chain amino acid transport system II carrier protein n=1 Tax=unclassified Granulicatella TaxID=2630493 RepID=UPI001073DBF8|nr:MULTISPECIES: branched-chain amino acid transport system II carrier protein [unclassified Granulicatella]MBF0779629.1 branched-chain amino acid transport system II carrier protein [Granulicatella sp. 19428wC4_WM01]TFU96287.1 branched-chain amino acid transport system II carrier protein [Granulicatella sp. WM01]
MTNRKGFLTGVLLFGMFFGAANLIFPPSLGALSGENFWTAILGFIISGVGVAVITLIVGMQNPKGYLDDISTKISPVFAIIFLALLYLTIGPFFAIPRTATAAYDMGIKALVGDWTISLGSVTLNGYLLLFTAIYFAVAYLLALNPTTILTSVGKILTPIFAVLIVILVIVGAIAYANNAPIAAQTGYLAHQAFSTGFTEGYNTLDALAAVAFSVVAVNTLKQFGFSSRKEYTKTIWSAGIVVAIGFSLLYIGLANLGNKFPIPQHILESDVNKGSYIISQATQQLFGAPSQIFLAIMVTLTCFTTAVGLIVATAEFFYKIYPKLTYKQYVLVFTIIGFAISNLGLTTIIKVSIPVLLFLYPITIINMMLIAINRKIALSKRGMQLTVGLVSLFALIDTLAVTFKLPALTQFLAYFPLGDQSLAWLVPACLGILLALVLPNKISASSFEEFN